MTPAEADAYIKSKPGERFVTLGRDRWNLPVGWWKSENIAGDYFLWNWRVQTVGHRYQSPLYWSMSNVFFAVDRYNEFIPAGNWQRKPISIFE